MIFKIRGRGIKGETHKALILSALFLGLFLISISLTSPLISAWNFQGEFATVNINVSYYNASGIFVAKSGDFMTGDLNMSGNMIRNVSYINPLGTTLRLGGDIIIPGNLTVSGNASIKRPYGMFSDMNIQSAALINTAYSMTFNITEDSYLINKNINNYTFSVSQTGDYLIMISIIAQSTINQRVWIWVRINNTDVPRSATIYDFKSNAANAVIAVPFILDLNTVDNFSILWASDSTNTKIMSFNKTAFAPETPGTIMTITKISEISH